MARYRCEHCGTALESDVRPGGQDRCPVCRRVNLVPEATTSRWLTALRGWWQERKLRREEARERRERSEAAMAEAVGEAGQSPPAPLPEPPRQLPRAPGYWGLELMAALIALCGVLCWLGAAAVVGLAYPAAGDGSVASAVGVGMRLMSGVWLFVVGLVLIGVGQFFSCVRDVAINTFNTAAWLAARED